MSKVVGKICMVGAEGVGKTSLVRRYVDNQFSEDYLSTIGVQISQKTVTLEGKKPCELILWDLQGAQLGVEIPKNYFTGARGFIFVADATRQSTMSDLSRLLRSIKDNFDSGYHIFVLNKIDQLSQSEGQRLKDVFSENFLKSENEVAPVFLTSAKMGTSVEDVFTCMAKGIV